MKTFIIDDERLARQELKNLLKAYNGIEIIGESGHADEAIKQIEELQPDLIFLDIQMPGKDGFMLLQELQYMPKVIFVTAYDEYALRAFEVNALDYLLKPVQPERLQEAINKVLNEESAEETAPQTSVSQGVLSTSDMVFLKDGEKCWFVKLADVRLFESEGNYIRVFFENNKPLILKSLNNLSDRLNPKEFFRANRKHILNLAWIERVESWYNGGLMVQLKTGEKIEVSRRQAVKLKELMSL